MERRSVGQGPAYAQVDLLILVSDIASSDADVDIQYSDADEDVLLLIPIRVSVKQKVIFR